MIGSTSSAPLLLVALPTIILIGLKLAGLITWSWLLVLSPIWLAILIIGAAVLTLIIMEKRINGK